MDTAIESRYDTSTMINVEIIKNYNKWREYKAINKALIKKVTQKTLSLFDDFSKIKQFELSILLTNNEEILTLNKQFRNIEKATNVLSFPVTELNWQELRFSGNDNRPTSLETLEDSEYIYSEKMKSRHTKINLEKSKEAVSRGAERTKVREHLKVYKDDTANFASSSSMHLGDIAFCYDVIYNESCEQKKTFENHFIHLLIHSILHLIGFDHQNDKEANIMESLEIEILSYFGIPSPY